MVKLWVRIAGTSEWTTIASTDNDKTLSGLIVNTEYTWQVKSICGVDPIVSYGWSQKQFFTTDLLRLSELKNHEGMFEIYPNPLSQSATISFFLNEASTVIMEILDVNGRPLKIIADENFSDGIQEVTINPASLSPGIYFLQVKTNEIVMLKKIVVSSR